MKRLGRVLGNLLAVALTVVSLQAVAETQLGGRDFNHMTTGFPLSGGHAAAACETCHMGGVFKGLPRTCDGCHQAGQRIVATPKSASHIVTDSPCESCHFNTSTFLGARFNHGTAKTGQCSNCHNGRISTGKPVNTAIGLHPVTMASCDQCHRASAWIPASWNHTGVTGDCSTCHRAAGPGRGFNVATHMSTGTMSAMNIANCNVCHKNYYTFLSAFYDHSGAPQTCQTCHGPATVTGGTTYTGVKPAGSAGYQMVHAAIGAGAMATVTCGSCHKSYASFLGARYDHAVVGTGCVNCHASPASTYNGYVSLPTSQIHAAATTVGIMPGAAGGCGSCHSMTNFSSWSGARYAHNDAAYVTKMAANSCRACHTTPQIAPIRSIPPNHLNAFAANLVAVTTNCAACHTSTGTWAQMNHAALTAGGAPCKNCHDSGLNPSKYFMPTELKKNGHKGYSQATQDCISCHANQYSSWNHP